ncbi:MAG: NHL repeat-containing protein, partial [Kiritimatiellae bacterium]|nr:NHL repeat-containing protein [Kiritimatiellia bacterium]
SLDVGASDKFLADFLALSHTITTDEDDSFQNNVILNIIGAATGSLTNTITAMTSSAVTDWLDRPIAGSGGVDAGLIQLIYVGTNGVIDSPALSGAATGDDILLFESSTLLTYGRFGAGGVLPNAGKFSVPFLHGLNVGDKVYARAWNGSSYVTSVAYGDSALVAVSAGVSQTIDFGAWQVGAPLSCTRDANGDTINDGWYVMFDGDPAIPLGALSPDWTAEAVAGTAGSAAGQMSYPEAVAAWSDFVYVADTQNDRIQVWNRDMSTNLFVTGSFGSGSNELSWPQGLVVNEATEQLIVSDTKNNRVVVYDINAVSGELTLSFIFGVSGSGLLNLPRGVALDSSGNIYVADKGRNRVAVFDAAGVYLRQIFVSAQPSSVALDSVGKIYVALSTLNRIDIYDNAGAYIETLGSAGAAAGQFSLPEDVKIGRGDRVYVVDKSNHRIQLFDSSLTYLASYRPPLGVMGTAEGELRFPYGMCLDAEKVGIYVADTWNHRVQLMMMIIDADGDGMDDVWEDANGLDSSDSNDWAADPDGDGLSNIGEYRIGTDPQNRDTNSNGIWDGVEVGNCEDPLGLFYGVAIDNAVDNGFHAMSWNGDYGAVYNVEMSINIMTSNWVIQGVITSSVDGIIGWT